MNTDKIMSADAAHIMHTYGRLPVVPSHGKSATLFDIEGKKYIDFTSGIGVNSLGFADKGWCDAVTSQAEKFAHVSNYYYCETASLLAEKLTELTGLKKVFFANSGAEANEGAIKLARKYSFDKYGAGRHTVITLTDSFHGRTVTTLSATGQDKFHNYFFPFTDGFRFSPANDIDALKAAVDDTVCAIMMEPIQGEGGVNIVKDDFVKAVKDICDEKDILLIFDEVQTGVSRTGKFLASQYFGVDADIVTLAKGLGGGLPIGAFLAGSKCAETLCPGDHGSTFGGNPVSCAAACEVVDRLSGEEAMNEILEKGKYISDAVRSFGLSSVVEVRGKGLMIGIQVNCDPKLCLTEAVKNGLLILTAGKDVVRLLPPLTITFPEIDEGLTILKKILTSTGEEK